MRIYLYKSAAAILLALIAGELWLSAYLLGQSANLSQRPLLPWSAAGNSAGSLALPSDRAVDIAAALERPMFSPTRRPFVPAPQPVEEPPPVPAEEPAPVADAPAAPIGDPSSFQLKGILVNGTQRYSLIATPEDPQGTWRVLGNNVAGWTINEIGDDRLVLKAGEQTFVLKQYVDNSELPLGAGGVQ